MRFATARDFFDFARSAAQDAERIGRQLAEMEVRAEGSGSGGEEVQQVDALGRLLGEPGEGGEVNEQQGAAPDAEGGEDTGGSPGQEGDEDAHAVSAFHAP